MARGRKAVQEEFEPESVAEGVSRETPIENPNDAPAEPQMQGNWIKATIEEVKKYEDQGKLIGFKPATMEVLLKESV
jgi:hypothetical protein